MNKIHKLQAVTELIPHTNYEGPTGKVFTWIESQLIIWLVAVWLIVGGTLLLFLHVLKWLIDLFVKCIVKLIDPLQKRNVLNAHIAEEQDPTHLQFQNINLN